MKTAQMRQRIADLERAVAVLAFACKVHHGDTDRVQVEHLALGTRITVELSDKTIIVETRS